MRRSVHIQEDLKQIHTIKNLSEVFESIASIRITKIRNRVVASKHFFAELWQTYTGLRVNPKQRLTRKSREPRDVFLAITAESKLGGSIDEKVIDSMLDSLKDKEADIVVIGNHGYKQLMHRGVKVTKLFAMPKSDVNFSVSEIIALLNSYKRISVFYQTYDSLRVQKAAKIELISAVRELGQDISKDKEGEVVSSRDYIFEPNINKIADYMESVMLEVALTQLIMESKLAQYANRFNNMSRAKKRAKEIEDDYRSYYYRSKRSESDERLKEILKITKAKGTLQ